MVIKVSERIISVSRRLISVLKYDEFWGRLEPYSLSVKRISVDLIKASGVILADLSCRNASDEKCISIKEDLCPIG